MVKASIRVWTLHQLDTLWIPQHQETATWDWSLYCCFVACCLLPMVFLVLVARYYGCLMLDEANVPPYHANQVTRSLLVGSYR